MEEENLVPPQDQQEPSQVSSVLDQFDKIKAPKSKVGDALDAFDDLESKTNPQINYSISQGAQIDGPRAKRILNVQRRLSPDAPVPYIDRNLDYLEQKTSEKDFKSEVFFNEDQALMNWVTENAPKAALVKSNPEEMRRLGLMKLLIERPPTLWPMSNDAIDADARHIAQLRAERDWKLNPTATDYSRMTAVAGGSGVSTTLPVNYSSQKQMEESYYQQELEKRHHIEGIVRGTDQLGPLETLIARYPDNPILKNITGLIPIVAHAPQIVDKAELMMAAKAEKAGNADEIQLDLLRNARRLEAVTNLRGKSFLGNLSEQGAAFPAMAGEFALGGGIGRAAIGEAATSLAGKAFEALAESLVAGSTVGLPSAAETFIERATPKGALGEDKDGNLVFQYKNEKDEPLYFSIPKAGFSSFADYFGAKIFGPWFSQASPAEQLLAKQSLIKAFPVEAFKMVGMNEASSLIKGLGGVQDLKTPDVVNAFSDPEAFKRVTAQMLLGGTMGAVHASIHNSGLPDIQRKFEAAIDEHLAKIQSEGIDQLNKLAQESVVVKETPSTGNDFVKRFASDGNEHVYAPIEVWDKYWTSKGVSPREVARAVMGDTAAYDESKRLKTDLQIPIENYVTKLGHQEEHADIFTKEFKLDPNIPSLTQAKEATNDASSKEPLIPSAYLDQAGQATKDLFSLGLKGEKAAKMQDALDNAMGPGLEKLKDEEISRRRTARNQELNVIREQVRPQVETMVNERPEQKAVDRLKAAEPGLKLSSDEVDGEHYPKGISHKEGMSADDAADMFGFNSGEELKQALRDLHNAPKRNDLIKDQVDAIIHETRPDLFQPPTLTDAEIEEIKGDNHSKLLRMQWKQLVSEDFAKAKGLIQATDRKPRPVEEVKLQAQANIGEKSVRDINPAQYKSAMEAAGQEAMAAILKGDLGAAADAKDRELDAYEHYRAALDAKRNIAALVNWAKRTQSKDFQAKLGKADQAYLEQYKAIAARFELTKASDSKLESRQALRDFIAEKEANGESLAENVSTPEWLLNEANKKNYKELTYDDFRDVMDLVTQLDKMATLRNKLIAGEKAVEWDSAEGKIVDEIRANKEALPVGATRSAETWLDKLKEVGRKVDASLLKAEQILKEMTGGNIASELMNRFWHPLADAQAAEYDYNEKITSKIAQAIKEMPQEIRDHMRDAVSFPGARKMTRLDLVGLGLNAGNESNLSKLVRGEMQRKGGLTERQIHDALNMLSASEIEYINKIHQTLESMWPDIAKLHTELTGLPPDKVTPKTMKLENGTIDGGYYPIVYDASESTQGAKQQEARVGDMIQPGYARATMGQGHRLSRVEGFAAPIDFDIDNLPSHIGSVVKDITHRRWLLDANKILSSEAIQSAIKDTHGNEILQRLREVTKEVVNDRNQASLQSLSVWRRLVSGFRTNTAIVATGLKLGVMLEHTFGIGAGIDELGMDYFSKGLSKTLQSPREAFKQASEKSGEIRHFLENGNRDIRDKLRQLEGRSDHLAQIQRTAAYGIGFANMARALPIWWGAYEKALASLPESHGFKGDELEKYAVRSADQALRLTVGTAGAKDLTAVQSGSRGGDIMKMFTMFYTPGAVLYSRLHDIGHEAAKTKDIPNALVRAFWVIPFAATMQALVKGDFPKEDKDETWAGWWFKHNATYPFSSVPIVRDIANAAAYGRDSSISTPGVEAMKGIFETADFTKRAMDGEETTRDAVHKGFNVINSYVGLPTQQLWSIGDYLYDLEKGETQSNNILGLYRDLLHYHHKSHK